MNQDEFAALAGVSRRAQVNYESGERAPDAGYFLAVAAAGVDVVHLITGTPAAATQKLAAVSEARDILVKMGLPEEQSRVLMPVLFQLLTAQQPVSNASTSTDLTAPLTPRERALLDNYRHSDEEAQRALDKTSAALAQPVAPAAATPKRPRKAG